MKFLLSATLALLPLALPAQELKLWPKGAPGSESDTRQEEFKQPDPSKRPTQITYVNQPTITVFLPPQGKANGMAMVVAPGGGHSNLAIDHEGWQVAEWLNQQGIAAFVLKYRLARAKDSHYTVLDHALPDCWRAIRTVRARAAEWHIRPDHVGFMGFSAGGEMAALVETRYDAGDANAADPVDRMTSRPDFTAIIYPGFRPGAITVPKDAPPAFLVCANDDPSHVVTTVNLYLDLQKQGDSAEMHIYASGAHGFGMRATGKPSATWNVRFLEWLADRKLLPVT